jgi:hypothetical protein
MVPGEPLAHFVVEAFAADFRIRNKDLGHDVTGLKNVFMFKVYLRQDEKFLQRQNSFSRCVDNFNLRIKRNQNGGEIRWMNDKARAASQNRVVAAIAGK